MSFLRLKRKGNVMVILAIMSFPYVRNYKGIISNIYDLSVGDS